MKLIFDWEQLSDFLKEYAEATGETCAEIAEAAGASYGVVMGLYTGAERNPPINDVLAVIAHVYEDTYTDFLIEVKS